MKVVINETSTLRRHVESYHKVDTCTHLDIYIVTTNANMMQPEYDKWCGLNMFELKLPKVVCKRKETELAEDWASQQLLDPHLTVEVPWERVAPYSDDIFRGAATQWLVETHQVNHVLCNLVFGTYKYMI